MIPEEIKHLFKESSFGQSENRVYKFIGLDESPREVELQLGERLLETRCPIDGCYIKRYDPRRDSEPTLQECPACEYDPRTSIDFFHGTLKREIQRGENIGKNILILSLMNTQNSIKRANLRNSLYDE
jgi:hypothetical protein